MDRNNRKLTEDMVGRHNDGRLQLNRLKSNLFDSDLCSIIEVKYYYEFIKSLLFNYEESVGDTV